MVNRQENRPNDIKKLIAIEAINISLEWKRKNILQIWNSCLKDRNEQRRLEDMESRFNPQDYHALPGNGLFNPLRPISFHSAKNNRYSSSTTYPRTHFRSNQPVPPHLKSREKKFPPLDEEAIKAKIEMKKAKQPRTIQGIIFISICLFF